MKTPLYGRHRRSTALALALCLYGLAASSVASVPGKPVATPAVSSEASMADLSALALAGNAEAQYALGVITFTGTGVAKDEAAGMLWVAKAADQGYVQAQNVLASAYATGRGVPRDAVLAAQWYRKAAVQHDPHALHSLAFLLESGNAAAKDTRQAWALRREAAELGHAGAQVILGDMYFEGRGVPQSDAQALEWYRKSAMQGHADGQVNLGYMTQLGRGLRPNEEEASQWYRKAALQGQAIGQNNLARLYASGIGVTRDYKQAVIWFRKAAQQGYLNAQISLAFMYRNGDGVPRDDVQASEWFRLAAMQGDFSAMVMMGSLYETGRGVAVNRDAALGWRRKAVEQQLARKISEPGGAAGKAAAISREALFLLQEAKQEAASNPRMLTAAGGAPKNTNGKLEAELIVTDDPKQLQADWDSPNEHVDFRSVDGIRTAGAVHGYVFFKGCTANVEGKCTVSLNYKVFFPDGSLHSMSSTGFPLNNVPAERGLTLGFGMPVAIDAEQPVGTYVVQSRVRDLNSDATLDLQRSFTVSK